MGRLDFRVFFDLIFSLLTKWRFCAFLVLIAGVPFLLAGTRFLTASVFEACGFPPRVSLLTTDLVIFFLASLLLSSFLEGHSLFPDLAEIATPFRTLAEALQTAGLR